MYFLCDAMLAKLARWLRIFGYDTELVSDLEHDNKILEQAAIEDRILLTRDKKLTERYKNSLYIPYNNTVDQMKLVVKEFKINLPEHPVPKYCSLCNGKLIDATNPPEHVTKAWQCTECGQQYWEGAHWKGIKKFIEQVKA